MPKIGIYADIICHTKPKILNTNSPINLSLRTHLVNRLFHWFFSVAIEVYRRISSATPVYKWGTVGKCKHRCPYETLGRFYHQLHTP